MAVVHLDESCLGNGRAGSTPGGAGGLIEFRGRDVIERRDIYLHHPDTTNNRMAIQGAITTLEVLARKGNRFRTLIISDSQYLVKGMREWVPAWRSRGWRRKSGPIENLALWQELVDAAAKHDVQWTWVRGHEGHVKNEFANDMAVRAAEQQIGSRGAVPSDFPVWLTEQQERGRYLGFDPDEDYANLESLILSDRPVPLATKSGSSRR